MDLKKEILRNYMSEDVLHMVLDYCWHEVSIFSADIQLL